MSLYVDIKKSLGSFKLNIKFETERGTLALLGASGCGKSMTLKCIAGIEMPDEGLIVLDGVTLFDSEKKINLPPQKRKTGYLFQNSALFPNMTSEQNILCGMRRIKSIVEKQQRLQELMSICRLEGLLQHYPHQLSGGQQQRVALARILASEPELIMLDEPFSALDSHLKWQLEQELRDLLARLNAKAIFVSHNRNEVYRLCENVAVMSQGFIDSLGSRNEVFSLPKTYNSCLLTGCKNIAVASKTSCGSIYVPDWGLELQTCGIIENDMKFAGIRAHNLMPCDSLDLPNAFEFEVVKTIEDHFSLILAIRKKNSSGSQTIRWEIDRDKYEKIKSSPKYVYIPPENVLLLKT